ncbi:MAG TPA: glycosyltransferase, partial [Bryobacteraceae bacterium]
MTSSAQAVKVLFASGSEPVIAMVRDHFRAIFPELPLVVVSEFPPPDAEWIPYHLHRSWNENRDLIRARLGDRSVRLAAVILEPRIPHWRLRALGFSMAPLRFLAFNETGGHFMLRPRSVPSMLRHLIWRSKNLVRSQLQPESSAYRTVEWFRNPRKFRLSVLYRMALARGRKLARSRPQLQAEPLQASQRPRGVSVVIPSRNGRDLLAGCLPGLQDADEIIIVDNGSTDGTADFLAREYPKVLIESSAPPLAFAAAVNQGIGRARFSHVCLLNNDMLVDPGLFPALLEPFDTVPDLFSSS